MVNRGYHYYLDGLKVNGKRRRLFFASEAEAKEELKKWDRRRDSGCALHLDTDNGPDFTSQHLEQVAADLKMRLVFRRQAPIFEEEAVLKAESTHPSGGAVRLFSPH